MEFIDLKAQLQQLRPEVDQAIAGVLDHGKFILGPEVQTLEKELASYAQVAHCVSCANGTDALVLALRALDIGVGDAVIIPCFTFAATAEAVCDVGATPIFVDVSTDTFNVDVTAIPGAIDIARKENLVPKATIAVDLFGLPADYSGLSEETKAHGMHLIADAAQSFGATAHGRPVGSLADITTTSFFPAKPLGCYGDGGAIFTADSGIAERVLSLRVHGKGNDKYDNVRVGYNSRLDTLQAAILLVKLKYLKEEITKKAAAAQQYSNQLSESLPDKLITPSVNNSMTSAWAQYTVRCDPGHRQAIVSHLKNNGIPTAIYYPTPLHKSTAYGSFPTVADSLSNAEQLSRSVFSLPMHAYMTEEDIAAITGALRGFDWTGQQ